MSTEKKDLTRLLQWKTLVYKNTGDVDKMKDIPIWMQSSKE